MRLSPCHFEHDDDEEADRLKTASACAGSSSDESAKRGATCQEILDSGRRPPAGRGRAAQLPFASGGVACFVARSGWLGRARLALDAHAAAVSPTAATQRLT